MEKTTTRKTTLEKLEDAVVKITNKKFCSSCQLCRSVEHGKMVMRGKYKQWRCGSCLLSPQLFRGQ
jgi:hypothetical protein